MERLLLASHHGWMDGQTVSHFTDEKAEVQSFSKLSQGHTAKMTK